MVKPSYNWPLSRKVINMIRVYEGLLMNASIIENKKVVMNKNNIENLYKTKLIDRAILKIEGNDNVDFLQNLISNNVELVSEFQSIYSTLLNPQGKFLFDFIIF